jgi:outer membrane protein insertion porin family
MTSRFAAVLFFCVSFFMSAQSKVLDTLVIKGLTINTPNIVRNAVDLRRGREFTASDIKESVRKLYGTGLFRYVDIYSLEETDSSASLLIEVEEFPYCESIEYVGNKKLKQKDLEEKIPVKKGQIVTDNTVFRAQTHIKNLYEKKGYLLAEVTPTRVPSKVPGNVIIKFVIKEGVKVQVKNIAIKGCKEVREKTLKGKFKTKEARWWRSGDYDEEGFRANLDTLIMYYNELGYLDASVLKDSVSFSANKKDISIEITVEEGKKYYTGRFFFSGNTVVPSDSLATKVMLKEGKPFQKSRFDMTKYYIENAYREEGYLWVNVDEARQYRGDTIDVTFTIFEGKPAIVRKIDIRGNVKTREKVIRREIDLLPGQRYRQSLMASSRQRIFALNFFSDVKPDLTPNNDGTIDMVFDITEKDNIGTFQVGAAYSQIDGFVGTLSLGIPNFRGAGEDLKIDLQAGLNRRSVDLGFKEPWAFDSPTSLSGSIFYNWNVPRYYSMYANIGDTLLSYGCEVGVGRSRLPWPDNHFSVDGSYRISKEMSSWGASSAPGISTLKSGWLSRVTFDITRYDFDMPQFPTSGSRFSISPQIAGLGGDFKYLKGTVDYEHHFPLPFKLVLGSKTKFGLIAPIGDSISISRYDLFKIGGVYGDADLRGYKDFSFGGYYGRIQDGLSLFTSTLEVRYPILEQQLYLGIFADIGNTWPGLAYVNMADVYRGLGFGLRLNIPMMGLMGFDFGWPLDHNPKEVFGNKPGGMEVHFLMNRGF